MKRPGAGLCVGALVLAGIAVAIPAYAVDSAAVPALAKVERGRWQVRELDNAVPAASLCLGDPAQLVRFQHRTGSCPLEVLESGSKAAVVQYNCRRSGFGHSHVRVETPRLVRIDTQGLSNGRPFSYRLEARRTGPC